MATDHLENDERQASLTLVLTAIMAVIISGMIVASVLSTQACTV